MRNRAFAFCLRTAPCAISPIRRFAPLALMHRGRALLEDKAGAADLGSPLAAWACCRSGW